MSTWFECINHFRKTGKKRKSTFTVMDANKYEYVYSDLYLGSQGMIKILVKHVELSCSYSTKDGLFVNIQSKSPYRVLFNFIDGSYFINDTSKDQYYALISSLFELKNESSKYNYTCVFDRLESIMYRYICKQF